MTPISRFGEIRDYIGLVQGARCLERHQFWIAGADANADQLAGIRCARHAHRPGLDSALMAAAVMALPPIRPRTIKNGTPSTLSASASFDSAAPTKPTGMPTITAGLGAPASNSSSSRNSDVGALPIATTAPPTRSSHKSSAAADRVVLAFAASAALRGSLSV